MMSFCLRRIAAGLAVLFAGGTALAQTAPFASHQFPMPMDSGVVQNDNVGANEGDAPALVYSNEVRVMGASWLRLKFDEATLSGMVEMNNSSYLIITSLRDNAFQRLNARSIREWSNTSAYFNGDAVRIELFAYPMTGGNRIRMSEVTGGEFAVAGPDDICGATDDRTLSTYPAQGRIAPIGCTGWLITNGNFANRALSAGHCFIPAPGAQVLEFNVPLSTVGGAIVHPGPEHQYAIDMANVQATQTVIGNDFSQFFTFANSNTGLHAREAQGGAAYAIANAPAVAGQTLRVTGYGTTNPNDPPGGGLPFNQSQVQKTHTGPYSTLIGTKLEYDVDTSGGNSGSPIVNGTSPSNVAIGIHTNAGCASNVHNSGTAIQNAGLQAALANPLGVGAAYSAPTCLQTLFASNNGGSAGGAVYFDINVAGTNDLEITHLSQNVNFLGGSFNIEVYLTPDTSIGKELTPAAWSLVATGSGAGETLNGVSLVALSNRFTLQAGQKYGMAIRSNLTGHRYTDGDGTNEVYTNSNLTLTFGKASNVAFTAPLITGERVWNGQLCYNVRAATGNCLQTLFAANNNGSLGGAVYFDANVSAVGSINVTGLTVNTGVAAGTAFNVTVYRKPGTYAGSETNPGLWTQVATGSATSAGLNVATNVALSSWFTLNAGSVNGIAIVMDAAGQHNYTNGTGTNQVYSNANLTISTGSASNTPFTAVFTPRVFNGSLCYHVTPTSCPSSAYSQILPNVTLGGFNSNNATNIASTQQIADNFSVTSNTTVNGLRLWAVYTGQNFVPASQSFTVNIYADAAGNPGAAPIYTANVSATPVEAGPIQTGFIPSRPLYQFDLAIPNFNAVAGTTYWLNPLGTTDSHTWCWQFITNPVGGSLRLRATPAAAWTSFPNSVAFQICGSAPCYANCDGSVVPPILNSLDFSCFLTRFAANDPYANCDNSVIPPVLNALDFSCFLTKFAQGCP